MSKYQTQKRKRGVYLSPQGWQQLQAAEQQTELKENGGKTFTLEQLSQRTGLSANTLTRVRRRRVPVDRQTLELYFKAFGLHLRFEDYVTLDGYVPETQQRFPLEGQVPLDSSFYIHRPPAEGTGCEAILQPGALVRIRGPRQFGKTSLMTRLLAQARQQDFHTAVLSLQLADSEVFRDLSRFLQWFCAVISESIGLPNRIVDFWDDWLGGSYNCTHYFERYLLKELEVPFVLALDEADVVFTYPDIASDFLSMLRAWHERAKYGNDGSQVWQLLRLLLVHSTEVYLPLNINQSPFNLGILIELSEFTLAQVEDLVNQYGLPDAETIARELVDLLGGNPYLTQLALHHLSQKTITLSQLAKNSVEAHSIFSRHLGKQLRNLQQYPELVDAFQKVIFSSTPVLLDSLIAFRLQSTGLIKLNLQQATCGCKLYQHYFTEVFGAS